MLKLVSLFTGAGGLDLGLEAAGFKTLLCVENDKYCIETLKKNRPTWKIAEPPDIFKLTPEAILKQAKLKPKELDLLAGGPPCQPFSKAGFWHRGDALRLKDPRAKTLHAYMRIVEKLQPKALLIENVEGINFNGKDEGMQLLKRMLKKINEKTGTKYDPVVFSVNAADYGVPQIRKRVFLVAFRNGLKFRRPAETHGEGRMPHVTAWDAIGELALKSTGESLKPKGRWTELLRSIPEGQNYLWHTEKGGGKPLFGYRTRFWSFLLKLAKNKPSWTIPAQPGPSTGPFHWDSRLLSIRELARIQTFPDWYEFVGTRQFVQKQIGNAVPPLLAEIIGRGIAKCVASQGVCETLQLIYAVNANNTSGVTSGLARVPKKYFIYVGKHAPHPGTGKGPGASRRVLDRF